MTANAATAKRLPWQVGGEMLKWLTDGRPVKPVIPIAVGERSIAFPRRSVKAGVDRTRNPSLQKGLNRLRAVFFIAISCIFELCFCLFER